MTQPCFKISALLPLVLMIAACASVASVVYPVNTDAARIKQGAYTLDPTHANVIFSLSHLGFSTYYGRFNKISGSLDFDEENPEASQLYISIEANSVDTNNATLDAMLEAESMFNAEVHPIITFVSSAIEPTGKNTGIVTGDLTLAGTTRPLSLTVTFVGSGTNPVSGTKTVGFNATGTLVRSSFGLKEWLPLVGDEVTLQIEAEFNPTPQ